MQIAIQTENDGAMNLRLDDEAANAMLASIRFAARFHPGVAILARLTEETLVVNDYLKTRCRRTELCQ
jgi:hypothetical protein